MEKKKDMHYLFQKILWSIRESTFKTRRGDCDKIPLIQDKEHRLCFAGAAMKRNPTSEVRETQVRR